MAPFRKLSSLYSHPSNILQPSDDQTTKQLMSGCRPKVPPDRRPATLRPRLQVAGQGFRYYCGQFPKNPDYVCTNLLSREHHFFSHEEPWLYFLENQCSQRACACATLQETVTDWLDSAVQVAHIRIASLGISLSVASDSSTPPSLKQTGSTRVLNSYFSESDKKTILDYLA